MTHPRTLIRIAMRDLLVNKTDAGDRVFKSRVVAWRERDLPAIAIYTPEETIAEGSYQTAPRELERTVTVVTEIAFKAVADVDDAADEIAWLVEKAVHKDETLGGLVSDCRLMNTLLEIFEQGDQLIAVLRLDWDALYYTKAPEDADGEPYDNFLRVDAKHNLEGIVHPDDEARDAFEVRTGDGFDPDTP